MKKILNTLIIASIMCVSLLHPIAHADFDKGMIAYKNKDYPTALKEFTESANQGDPKVQYRLGIMYALGEGVVQNNMLAYVLFNLAAAQLNEEAKTGRDLMVRVLTPKQLEEAQAIIKEWKVGTPFPIHTKKG